MIYCARYIQPQLGTEPVQSVRGPRQRSERTFWKRRVGLSKGGAVFRWPVCTFQIPRRCCRVRRQAVRQLGPAPGLWPPSSAPVLPRCTACGLLGPLPHLSSFALQPEKQTLKNTRLALKPTTSPPPNLDVHTTQGGGKMKHYILVLMLKAFFT